MRMWVHTPCLHSEHQSCPFTLPKPGPRSQLRKAMAGMWHPPGPGALQAQLAPVADTGQAALGTAFQTPFQEIQGSFSPPSDPPAKPGAGAEAELHSLSISPHLPSICSMRGGGAPHQNPAAIPPGAVLLGVS